MPTKSNEARKSKSIQLHMTDAMYANLVRLAGSDNSRELADLIRQAVRYYFDNHPDITGSRRYFTRRFQDRFSAMEERFEQLERNMLHARWDNVAMMLTLLYTQARLSSDIRTQIGQRRAVPAHELAQYEIEQAVVQVVQVVQQETLAAAFNAMAPVRKLLKEHAETLIAEREQDTQP